MRAQSAYSDPRTRPPKSLLWLCLLWGVVHMAAPGLGTAQDGERVTIRVDGRAVLRVNPAGEMDADGHPAARLLKTGDIPFKARIISHPGAAG